MVTLPTSELVWRIISGIALIALALFCTIYSPLSFYALLLVGGLLAYAEWLELTKDNHFLHKFGGIVYIGIPVWSLIALRGHESPALVLSLFAMVWATDIAAYFGGKKLGKHKLAPSISPGKTWEGLGCGMLGAGITGMLSVIFADFPPSIFSGFWIGCVIALVGQLGDLLESFFKRRAGVKDSGSLIPGHGGILDRIDSLITAAPVYTLLMLVMPSQ